MENKGNDILSEDLFV